MGGPYPFQQTVNAMWDLIHVLAAPNEYAIQSRAGQIEIAEIATLERLGYRVIDPRDRHDRKQGRNVLRQS
jgi:hypothetical protein